ncbi:hypothetical protein [Halogeometricum sp. CBA1124]|uniref:hypothetical protein n=1 Tax=Halogeometricum sp. CBA1124 TaxID=2668071 RepID=UPI00142BB3A8|nr:hypothetical protein [Halogeometricum sp. CBA1124]MUV57366.1 hypothetical protein [Halogeometricum sp. CBA1124]
MSPPAARTTNLAAVGVSGGDDAGDDGGGDADSPGGDVHLVVGTDDGLAVWTG